MDTLALRATLDWSSVSHGFDGMMAKAAESQTKMGSMFSGMASMAAPVAAAFVAVGVAAAGAVVAGTSAFMGYEAALTDVAKTTGLADAEVKKLGEDYKKLSLDLGKPVQDLERIGATLGSFGVNQRDQITGLTKDIVMMADAFGMTTDEVAQNAMGVAKGFNIPYDQMKNFGSMITTVGDTAGVQESKLLNYMSRVSSLASKGLNMQSLLSGGAIMMSQNVDAENAASGVLMAFNTALNDKATKTSPSKLELWMKALGYDRQTLMQKLQTDPMQLLGETFQKINANSSDAAEAGTKLGEIFGQEAMRYLPTLVNGMDEYSNIMGVANEQFETGSRLQDMYALKTDTLLQSWNKAKVAVELLGISIGESTSGPMKSMLDWFTSLYPAIDSAIKALLSGDFSAISDVFSNIGSTIMDELESIDYNAVGKSLYQTLKRAWGAAVSLFSAFMSSDTELTGAFTALADVLRPTFEDIFGTLQEAGLKALIAVGDAFYSVFNAAGKVVTDIMQIIIGEIADMAGALDEVTGGAISDVAQRLGILTPVPSSSTGTTQAEKVTISASDVVLSYNSEPVLFNKETGEKREFPGWSKQRTADFAAANPDLWSINKVTAQSATIDVQRGTLNLASAISDSKKDAVLSEMYGGKLHVQSVEANEANQFGGAPGSGWGLSSIHLYRDVDADKKQQESRDAWQEANSQNAEQATKTADQITDSWTSENGKQTTDLLNGIATASEENSKMTGESIHDTILKDFNPDDWKDQTWQNRAVLQSQLDVLVAERELMKQQLEATIKADPTSEDVPKLEKALQENAQEVAQAVSSAAAVSLEPFLQAFTGRTVDYAPTREANLKDLADSALVNARFGITTVGEMTGYTAYAAQKLAEAGIQQETVYSNIDKAIAALKEEKSGVDEVAVSTTDLGKAASEVDFSEATAGAEKLKSTCVEVTFEMENMAATAGGLKFGRSGSASPDALKQGIFETSATNPLKSGSTTQMTGGATATGGMSNAALSAIQRYTSQTATNTSRTSSEIVSYGRAIQSAVQLAGTNAASAINSNGTAINGSVNTQGSAIVNAINAGVAALIEALSSGGGGGSGKLGGPHSGVGSLGDVTNATLALDYGIFETSFSEGGYASRPMIALVGDSPGGEFMVPRNRLDEFVSSYMAHKQVSADTSSLSTQLMDAVGSINIPAIHLPVIVDFDSNAISEAVEYAIKNISSDIRLRARI